MRTITYKVSDEIEELLEREQQSGESLNQTARRLMTACLMQDGHTMEVNQSIPGIPQDSVVMSRLEKLEKQVEDLNRPQSNKVDQSVINGIKALESRLITLGDRVNALEKSDPLVSEFQPKYNERLDFIQDHLNALDALHFQDVDELEKRLLALEKNQPQSIVKKKIEVGCKVMVSVNASNDSIRASSGEVVKRSDNGWWVTVDKACYSVPESELIWLSAPPPPASQPKPEPKPEPKPVGLQPGDKIKIANIVPDAYAIHRGMTGRLEAIASDKATIKTGGKTITIPRKYIEFVPPEQKTTAKKSTGRRRKRTS